MPLILDQAKTQEQKQSLDLALARLEFGRPFFMPPNVPAERVNAIRRAFDAVMKDKEFLDEADKLKIEIDPLSGEQVAALIEQIYKTPAATVDASATPWRRSTLHASSWSAERARSRVRSFAGTLLGSA